MASYSMDNDEEYWNLPERFRQPAEFTPSLGVRATHFLLGDECDDQTPAADVLEMKPGYLVTRREISLNLLEAPLGICQSGRDHADG